MLPDTREMRALEAAVTDAVERMEELFNNGAVADGDAHGYRMQLKSIRTQVRRLADVFARADSVHGEAYPVYTVDVRLPDTGAGWRGQPPTKVFRSWEDARAFVAGVEFFDTVTVRSGMRRGDAPTARTPRRPLRTRPGGESRRAGVDTPRVARDRPAADSFSDAFVTVFAFSSTLLPAACRSCSHGPADHTYIGEFTCFELPGGATGVLPTRGAVICRLDACTCTGTWNLSVLSGEDAIFILPGNDVR
jgi:hypothetical protein